MNEPVAAAASQRPEAWITRATLPGSPAGPLRGVRVAVKDNIDVAGVPTTAACTSFAQGPAASSAPAVQLLLDAGATVVGRTNLDQFATGLVGVRSPHGAVRNALDPTLVSGGSSSGSAVAVALNEADLALGTDTAGSGRVPAGFNHIVGLKPTLGLVSSRGVVPACRSYDTVSVFARTLPEAVVGLRTICVPDPLDPRSRTWPDSTPLSAPREAVVATPAPENLAPCSAEVRHHFARAVARLEALGIRTVEVNIAPLLDAARLLYDGALVAERQEAYGAFAEAHRQDIDPAVANVLDRARTVAGWEVIRDQHRVLDARRDAERLFAAADALLVPTAPIHPGIAEVQADPMGLNSVIGTYTNFVNLLDLAAVSVPSSAEPVTVDGVTFIVPAFHDQVALDLAGRLVGEEVPLLPTSGVDVVMFGAHMRGLPLHWQIDAVRGRFISEVTTAPRYRMGLLEGAIARPGVTMGSTALPGEMFRIPLTQLPRLMLNLMTPPLGLGQVELSDGRVVLGCISAEAPARELPQGWRAHLAGA